MKCILMATMMATLVAMPVKSEPIKQGSPFLDEGTFVEPYSRGVQDAVRSRPQPNPSQNVQSPFCLGFTEGYQSIVGGMQITPICPLAPITMIGSTPFRDGLRLGTEQGKRDTSRQDGSDDRSYSRNTNASPSLSRSPRSWSLQAANDRTDALRKSYESALQNCAAAYRGLSNVSTKAQFHTRAYQGASFCRSEMEKIAESSVDMYSLWTNEASDQKNSKFVQSLSSDKAKMLRSCWGAMQKSIQMLGMAAQYNADFVLISRVNSQRLEDVRV